MTSKPERADYYPYDRFPAFNDGIAAYQHGDIASQPHGTSSTSAQAYDRGMEYAMRCERWDAIQS